MKILNVCDIMNPLYGGSIERAYQISKHMIDDGYDVDLLTTSWNIDHNYISNIGGKKFILDVFGRKNSHNPKIIPKGIFKWIKFNIDKYDVIHVSRNWSLLASIVAMMARKKNIPYVYSPMGYVGSNNKSKLIKGLFRNLFTIPDIKGASACIAVSKEEEEDINNIVGNSNKTRLIPNGIILSSFDYQNNEAFRSENNLDQRNIILFIGRMESIKGVHLLIDAYSNLQEIHDSWCLAIIGTNTEYKKEMVNKTNELKMNGNIFFLDPLFSDKKSAAYHAAEVVAIPSLKDAMTIIAPEAACCKKPILYTNTCDFSGLAINGGGMEVDPSVDAIQSGLKAITRPDFNRIEMGQKGYNYVLKNFKWTELIKKYEELFKSSI